MRWRGSSELVDSVLDPLADHIQLPLEALGGVRTDDRRAPAHEQLLEHRGHGGRAPADRGEVGGYQSPAEQYLPLLGDDPLDEGTKSCPRPGVRGKKNEAGAVRARFRQGEGQALAQEPVRHLHENARAVAGIGVRAGGTAVLEVNQQVEGLAHDAVRPKALDVSDEADAARIVFVSRSIQSLVAGVLRLVCHTRAPSRPTLETTHTYEKRNVSIRLIPIPDA